LKSNNSNGYFPACAYDERSNSRCWCVITKVLKDIVGLVKHINSLSLNSVIPTNER